MNTSYVCDYYESPAISTVGFGGSGLDSYVGVNVLQEMLYDPNCSFNSTCIERYLSVFTSSLISAGSGLVIMVIVVCLFLLFSPCLCSRRFRQWSGWKQAREYKYARDFSPTFRRLLTFLGIVVSLGAIVDVALIVEEKNSMDAGLNDSLCQVYMFLNETLYGGGATVFEDSQGYIVYAEFPGLTNAGELVSNLTELVAPNSSLIQELNSLMNLTGAVEEEYLRMVGLFTTLNDVMRLNAFAQDHQCLFCSNFSTYPSTQYDVNPAHPSLVAINSSISAVISILREQLKPFMVDELNSLYNALTDLNTAINSAVDRLTYVANNYILSDLDLVFSIFRYIDAVLIAILVITFVPIGLFGFSLYKGAFQSDRNGQYNDPQSPPTSPSVATGPMWISFIYTVVVLTSAGAILVAAHILASACLVMEDTGSAVSKTTYRFTSDDSVTARVSGIVHECLQLSTDGDVLSAITVDGQSTARDKVTTLAALEAEFTVLNAAINAGTNASMNLSGNVYLTNMGKYLASVGDLYLMNYTTQTLLIETNSSFIPTSSSAIFSTDWLEGLDVYYQVSATAPQCLERDVILANTPPGVLALLANYTKSANGNAYQVPGIDYFIETLNSYSVATGTDTCRPVNAFPSTNLVPWGNMLELKLNFIYNETFACSEPILTYDPVTLSFTLVESNQTCSANEYADYMAAYQYKIAQQAIAVDNVVAENYYAIFNETWDVIYGQLLQPVESVGSSLNCQFISIRWNSLYDSLCIVFTPTVIRLGKTLLALGFVGVFTLLVQIIIWRHLKDNMCLWRDAVDSASGPRRGSTFAILRRQSRSVSSASSAEYSIQEGNNSNSNRSP